MDQKKRWNQQKGGNHNEEDGEEYNPFVENVKLREEREVLYRKIEARWAEEEEEENAKKRDKEFKWMHISKHPLSLYRYLFTGNLVKTKKAVQINIPKNK